MQKKRDANRTWEMRFSGGKTRAVSVAGGNCTNKNPLIPASGIMMIMEIRVVFEDSTVI